ncbi:MAG: histidinol-phosphate transaminase [Lachnospiraceae bacterium]|nr:histidinol-phosphate transaminase [Lachnospiraceae bacterium]
MSWEKYVRKVEPYVPGEQPKSRGIIKLNTNECPYPPSKKVKRALRKIDNRKLRLYPDPQAMELVETIADYYDVKKNQVFVGVGSDDVLAMAFLTFFNSKKPILFPDITYSFYDVWAELYRIPYERIPLNDKFEMNVEDYDRDNGGIVIANPNAPTGLMTSREEIEKILKANKKSVVIVDEAYVDFGAESCVPLVDKYDNLLVVQTFSKSRALAGMRIGFAIGNKKLIQYLLDAKFSFNSYTMNLPSLMLGAASVKDDKYFKETISKVVNTREWTKVQLRELGFSFPDSKTNFIFATHKNVPAKELFEMLKKEKIYVRYFNKPRIDNYLRISIGTDEQMQKLIACLTKYLAKKEA